MAAASVASTQSMHRRKRLCAARWRRSPAPATGRGRRPRRLDIFLSEITANRRRAAADTVQQGVELAHLAHLHLPHLVGQLALGDPGASPSSCRPDRKGDALGRRAVAPGAANFLPVGLDRGRRIGVDDEAHVRLVESPMPKAIVATITAPSSARNQPSDRCGPSAPARRDRPWRRCPGRPVRRPVPRRLCASRVDDADRPGRAAASSAIRRPRPCLRSAASASSGAGEAGHELAGVLQPQLGADVGAGAGVGGRVSAIRGASGNSSAKRPSAR